jgi:hypothetical protein
MNTTTPRKILLFSGHMIDAPGRKEARFPADSEPTAKRAIEATLAQIGVDSRDLAICGGACGGDLLFAEACLRLGTKLELYIPFDEPTFLAKSIDFADADWRTRFFKAKSEARVYFMHEEIADWQKNKNPYAANNLWMLNSAIRFGQKRVVFICLWDGMSGDNGGGTDHLMKEIKSKIHNVYWLNTKTLWAGSDRPST